MRRWRRRLRCRWYRVVTGLGEWWRRHIAGDEWVPGSVVGILWGSRVRPLYRDGAADVFVSPGSPREQAEVYLMVLRQEARKAAGTTASPPSTRRYGFYDFRSHLWE